MKTLKTGGCLVI